jgi:hypothetical protein
MLTELCICRCLRGHWEGGAVNQMWDGGDGDGRIEENAMDVKSIISHQFEQMKKLPPAPCARMGRCMSWCLWGNVGIETVCWELFLASDGNPMVMQSQHVIRCIVHGRWGWQICQSTCTQTIVLMRTYPLGRFQSKTLISVANYWITVLLLYKLSKKFHSNHPLITVFLCHTDCKLRRTAIFYWILTVIWNLVQ